MPDPGLLDLYRGTRCAVTGGASFIGSHLAELLLRNGAAVTIVDDLSSGSRSNLGACWEDVRFVEANVQDRDALAGAFRGCDVVFHLAAIHGGRGFIDTFPAEVLENFALDFAVFDQAAVSGVKRVVHASSACVYPVDLQSSVESRILLAEDAANFASSEGSFPDGAYGWTKLMGEYQLEKIARSRPELSGRSARIFTAYGSRENESHAVVALWAKAALGLDPYPIWGDGRQTRNFTHVRDTVTGLALLGVDRRSDAFDAVNIGSSTHHTVMDAVAVILDLLDWQPSEIVYELDRPVGVKSRASDNTKIEAALGWSPSISLRDGLEELADWYQRERLPAIDRDQLEALLIAR